MVASDAPLDRREHAAARDRGGAARLRARAHPARRGRVAALAFDSDGTRAFAGDTPPNSDDRNLFATSSATRISRSARWLERARRARSAARARRDRSISSASWRVLRSQSRSARERIASTAASIRRAGARAGLARRVRSVRARRSEHFRAALAADPTRERRIGLALVDASAAIDAAARAAPARARGAAQRRSRGRARARRAARAMAAGELLYAQAAELRARWRFALGGPDELADAAQIIDTLLESVSLPRLLLLRAELAARTRRPQVAWLSLQAISEHPRAASPAVAERGLALARELGPPPSPELVTRLEHLARRAAAAVSLTD
jgi:hypothetical protein